MKSEKYEQKYKTHQTASNTSYILDVFGDTLAAQQGYTDIDGMDAIHLYLINKHGWLPRDVRSMTCNELQLALHVEMQGYVVPKEAQ